MFHTHSHRAGFTALIWVSEVGPSVFSPSVCISRALQRWQSCPDSSTSLLTRLRPQAKAGNGNGMEIPGPQHTWSGVGGVKMHTGFSSSTSTAAVRWPQCHRSGLSSSGTTVLTLGVSAET